MKPSEPTPVEEHCVSLLAACDEVLALGVPASSFCQLATPAELRPRLQRDLACVELLRRAWPSSGAASYPTAGTAGGQLGTTVTSVGRFQLRRELGQGGYGIVYLAYDPLLNREVALKIPRANVLISPELRARFQQEARAAAGLDHPNIVPVFEAGEAGPFCYIAAAYCPGITLADWLRQRTEPVPFRLAATIVAALTDGVQHAHTRGVLHRDLKPSNVLLEMAVGPVSNLPPSRAPGFVPKITDFGLAKLAEGEGKLTQSGAILGTPNYMAPEQAGGKTKSVSTAVDVYALGVILYELLTGRPPFQATTPLETLRQVESTEPVPPGRWRRQLPRDLETICIKCLQKEPCRRYASAAALGEDLRRFLAGEPVQARPVGPVQRLWRWSVRNPILAAVSTLAALALVAAAAVSLSFGFYQSAAAARLREVLDDSEANRKQLARTNEKLAQTHQRHQQGLRLSASMALERGLALCEQGEEGRGLLWLVRSLEMSPEEDIAFQHTARANVAGWYTLVHTLQAAHTQPQAGAIEALTFSPDGKVAVSGSLDQTARLWETATGKPIGVPMRHEGAVVAVAFSSDGKRVATGSLDHTARLWDAATGQPLGPPLSHGGAVNAVAVSPDGSQILTGSEDHTARIWEARTGKTLGPPFVHEQPVPVVAFSPDGKMAVTVCKYQGAHLWEVDTGKPLGLPLPREHTACVLAFAPDGKTFLTGAGDQTARLWETTTGKPIGGPLKHAGPVRAVAFSPDGRTVLTGSADNHAQLWEAATGKPLGPPLAHRGEVLAVAFSPDGQRVVTASADQTARLWDVHTGQPLGSPLPHQGEVQFLGFSRDGHTLCTVSEDQTVRLWKTTGTGNVPCTTMPHHGWVLAVAFRPDGKAVWTANNEPRAIHQWETRTGKPLGMPVPHPAGIEPLAFRPDGKVYLTAADGSAARLWETSTGKPLGPPLSHQDKVMAVAFSPDSKIALTGSRDKTARLWDAGTGQPIGQPLRHPLGVLAVAFSPDGKTIATGSGSSRQPGGEARLWDAGTGQPLGPPLLHQSPVMAVAISPDGKQIATGTAHHLAHVWEVATGKPLGPPLPQPGEVIAVAFSPDGRLLLTGSWYQPSRLWSVSTGLPIGPPFLLREGVRAAVFSPDGKSLLTASWQRAQRWRVPAPVAAEVERLVLWTQVVTGLELDGAGVARVLDAKTWQQRHQHLDELGGPPNQEDFPSAN